MKVILLTTLSVLFLKTTSFAQARLVITGSALVVIDNNAKVVIENPNTTGIQNLGTGGIVTESEFDQVVWKIGTNAGTYVMPFVSQTTNTQIPFTAVLNSGGAGATGEIRFSTYPGPVSDNNTYRPSDVTHMFDYNTNTINNSSHVIDRFWIIDALNYTTKPDATFSFTYRDSEHLQVGNTIVEADLGAQRFHPGPNIWGDYLPQGVTNTVANVTSGVPVVPADFWRSWTLSEVTNPLFADVLNFKSTCSNGTLVFSWQTQSETNLSHFELEKFEFGTYNSVASISPKSGVGLKNYTFSSPELRLGAFRLVEIDNNGTRTSKFDLEASCNSEDEAIVYFNNSDESLYLNFNSSFADNQQLAIFDASGKVVYENQIVIEKGTNTMKLGGITFTPGVYIVRLQIGDNLINKRIFKSN